MAGDKKKGRDRKRDLPSTVSIPKSLQWLALGQTKLGSRTPGGTLALVAGTRVFTPSFTVFPAALA